MKRHLAVIGALMYAAVALSQTTPADSPLVQAAKHNAEARRKAALNPGSDWGPPSIAATSGHAPRGPPLA